MMILMPMTVRRCQITGTTSTLVLLLHYKRWIYIDLLQQLLEILFLENNLLFSPVSSSQDFPHSVTHNALAASCWFSRQNLRTCYFNSWGFRKRKSYLHFLNSQFGFHKSFRRDLAAMIIILCPKKQSHMMLIWRPFTVKHSFKKYHVANILVNVLLIVLKSVADVEKSKLLAGNPLSDAGRKTEILHHFNSEKSESSIRNAETRNVSLTLQKKYLLWLYFSWYFSACLVSDMVDMKELQNFFLLSQRAALVTLTLLALVKSANSLVFSKNKSALKVLFDKKICVYISCQLWFSWIIQERMVIGQSWGWRKSFGWGQPWHLTYLFQIF